MRKILAVVLATVLFVGIVATPAMASVKVPDVPWPNILNAFFNPVIQTDNATYVATTTARLNATLIYDGSDNVSETAETRFQWYADVWGVDFSDNATAWVGGYDSGDKAFADITGLSPNTLYNFRSQAQNDGGANSANGTADQFTTAATVGGPTGFKAFPVDVSVDLTWTKGAGSSNTTIFFSTYDYPETVADGTLIYDGVLNTYTHILLTPGTTYYYTAWGLSGATYSTANVTVMATTMATTPGRDQLPIPVEPPTWFQTANVTKFQDMPFYDLINSHADGLTVPRASWWTMWTLFWIAVLSLITAVWSKRILPTFIVEIALCFIATMLGLISGWIGGFFIAFGVGLIGFISYERG